MSWTSGEARLGSYKVPEATRYRTLFCTNCGSPMPRVAPDLSFAVIPAGSLDTEAPLRPTDRIMWDSRADWSCESGDLPEWSEYPE